SGRERSRYCPHASQLDLLGFPLRFIAAASGIRLFPLGQLDTIFLGHMLFKEFTILKDLLRCGPTLAELELREHHELGVGERGNGHGQSPSGSVLVSSSANPGFHQAIDGLGAIDLLQASFLETGATLKLRIVPSRYDVKV